MAYDPITPLNLTAQTASIGTTTILTAPAAGLYRVSYYLHTTTAGSAGTVLLTLGWNDAVAQTAATSAISLSTVVAGTLAKGTVEVWLAAGQVLSYATTVAAAVGSPQYALRIRAQAL